MRFMKIEPTFVWLPDIIDKLANKHQVAERMRPSDLLQFGLAIALQNRAKVQMKRNSAGGATRRGDICHGVHQKAANTAKILAQGLDDGVANAMTQ